MAPELPQLPALLERSRGGDAEARTQLFLRAEEELRRIAHRELQRERPGHLLQTTALVNEAWLRLGPSTQTIEDRAHFLAIAAEAMRRVLVDEARRRRALKRGGERARLSWTGAAEQLSAGGIDSPLEEVEELHVALERFEAEPRHRVKARVVELRYFGGLTVKETAQALALSEATVKRHFEFARAWLRRELGRMRGES